MTFYQDPVERDVNPYVREPNRDTKTFEQEPLTVVDHIDPDKHWIGESLPVPGQGDLGTSGVLDSGGVSPFPARADHSHNNIDYWGIYIGSAAVVCPPGQTFLNTFSLVFGRNFLVGGNQIFQPNAEGNWGWDIHLNAARQGGGNFTGECNIAAFFNNGASNRLIWRDSMNGIPGSRIIDVFEKAYIISAPAAGLNVQFAVQHNDVVNYEVAILVCTVRRLHRSSSA